MNKSALTDKALGVIRHTASMLCEGEDDTGVELLVWMYRQNIDRSVCLDRLNSMVDNGYLKAAKAVIELRLKDKEDDVIDVFKGVTGGTPEI